ncbi:MAG: 3-hydroxyacyl-CoA dehydrogenase NAD-binding domain-containing protein, partial [Sulfitobacter sp.]
MTPTIEETGAYIAAAGKEAWHVPDLPTNTPQRDIKTVGIIGAGTMGGGIGMNFATAGYNVKIVETTQ